MPILFHMAESNIETDRRAFLDVLLDHVPFDGWTGKAMAAAAADAALDPSFSQRAFPRGPIDAIDFFNEVADEAMVDALQASDIETMRVRDRIGNAIRLRLEQNTQHRDAVRRALTTLSFPPNAPVGARCLYRTVDAIWRAAGDTATDFNFYTKRALLAGVYSSTLLYWLNDSSDGFERTWAFLDRRIEDVMRVPKITQRVKDGLAGIPDPMGFRHFFKRRGPGPFKR